MKPIKSCKHDTKRLVGETYRARSAMNISVYVYWCKKCGALGRNLPHKANIVWTKPE